jgi:hypothetical protein
MSTTEPTDAREAAFTFLDDGWIPRAARVIRNVLRKAHDHMVLNRLYLLLSLMAVLLVACHPDDSVRVNPHAEEPQSRTTSPRASISQTDKEFEFENGHVIEGRRIPGTPCRVEVTLSVTPLETDHQWVRAVLTQCTVTPMQSSPRSVILAGKVISDNALGPLEGIPIFFGTSSSHARLAGLTDAHGEFRFRIWLRKKSSEPVPPALIEYHLPDAYTGGMRRQSLSASALEDGVLYLGGRFNERMEIISCSTLAYALRDLLQESEDAPKASKER